MVCIAAFIILCLIGVFVAILSIWRRDIGRKYWAVFKKAWGCVGKRVTLQKCETNFKDDVKNSILRKVVIKQPKLVKPIGTAIEVVAVLIVLVTIWSLVEAGKAGLSLYALGTCNPARPDACIAAATDVCPVGDTKLNWFEEWGEIFAAMPDRMKNWDAREYLPENPAYYRVYDESKPVAVDVFDPGCDKCLQSFRNQLAAGFFDSHNVAILPYPTEGETRDYRFNNSYVVSAYMMAAAEVPLAGAEVSTPWRIVEKLFTGFNGAGVIWQSVMKADDTSEEMARQWLEEWLEEFGYAPAEIERIRELADGEEMMQKMQANQEIVKNKLHIKGVPTTVYDGRKHTGIYKNE
jgi:hypothetical protein